MVLDLFFQVSVIFLEIPTGLFADAIGRRWSLRCAALGMFASIVTWALATSIWWMVAAWALWAFGATFLNGADVALIYESLLADGRGHKFGRVIGRFTTYSLLGIVLASLVGGWLAQWGYRVPIFAHAGVLCIALFASSRLREPPRAEQVLPGKPREIIRALGEILGHSARFRILLGYAAAVQAVEVLVIVYQQPLLVAAGLNAERLGVFYAVVTLIAAGGPVILTWASARLGMAPVLGAAGLGIAASTFVLYFVPGMGIILPLTLVRFFADGARPVTIDGMNRLVGPRGRATVLSVRSMCVSAVVGPLEVVSGWWADRVPIRRIFLACGIGLPLVVSCLGWAWNRKRPCEHPAELAAEPATLTSDER
jgi:predicted MFS family arabinose efflux permease